MAPVTDPRVLEYAKMLVGRGIDLTMVAVMVVGVAFSIWISTWGVDFTLAVVRGAAERLVPILMTALAAGLALVPIALSAGEPGSEIQAPMAMVIMFGLLSSTALNMIVVPILYVRFGRPVTTDP